jgi:hypothetical protein
VLGISERNAQSAKDCGKITFLMDELSDLKSFALFYPTLRAGIKTLRTNGKRE